MLARFHHDIQRASTNDISDHDLLVVDELEMLVSFQSDALESRSHCYIISVLFSMRCYI